MRDGFIRKRRLQETIKNNAGEY